jgi:hypothetical protein
MPVEVKLHTQLGAFLFPKRKLVNANTKNLLPNIKRTVVNPIPIGLNALLRILKFSWRKKYVKMTMR